MDTPILSVDNLQVSYGGYTAVGGISFTVGRAEIFGLLGPNGAGKTSTLSAIEGLLVPQAGTVQVAGYDIRKELLEARANLGIQLQSTSFQSELTVKEIVALYAGVYGVTLSAAEIQTILKNIELQNDANKRAKQLSGGQQQRLSLAVATLHNPPLILLDEPTTGLDPQSRRALWERIDDMKASGRSILLTTHSMEEAHAICNRIAIIDHGKIIATGNPDELIEKYKDMPEVRAVMRRSTVTLEDVFIGLTGKAIRN